MEPSSRSVPQGDGSQSVEHGPLEGCSCGPVLKVHVADGEAALPSSGLVCGAQKLTRASADTLASLLVDTAADPMLDDVDEPAAGTVCRGTVCRGGGYRGTGTGYGVAAHKMSAFPPENEAQNVDSGTMPTCTVRGER